MKITFLRTKKVNYMQIYLKEEELEKDNTKEIIKKMSEDNECLKCVSWKECKDIIDNINEK